MRALRAVLATVGDQALAGDMVAEAFARAWTSSPKVSRYAAPRGWVVRTALNAGVSWWRPRRREIPLADYGTVTLTLTSDQVFNPGALQQTLQQDGIPALVETGSYCSTPTS